MIATMLCSNYNIAAIKLAGFLVVNDLTNFIKPGIKNISSLGKRELPFNSPPPLSTADHTHNQH